MQRHLQPAAVGTPHIVVQLLLAEIEDAAVAWAVDVGMQEGSCPRLVPAVHQDATPDARQPERQRRLDVERLIVNDPVDGRVAVEQGAYRAARQTSAAVQCRDTFPAESI